MATVGYRLEPECSRWRIKLAHMARRINDETAAQPLTSLPPHRKMFTSQCFSNFIFTKTNPEGVLLGKQVLRLSDADWRLVPVGQQYLLFIYIFIVILLPIERWPTYMAQPACVSTSLFCCALNTDVSHFASVCSSCGWGVHCEEDRQRQPLSPLRLVDVCSVALCLCGCWVPVTQVQWVSTSAVIKDGNLSTQK